MKLAVPRNATLVPLLAAAALSACGKPAPAPAVGAAPAASAAYGATRKVTTVAATTCTVPEALTLAGSIIADRTSQVAANAMGRVIAVPIERGQRVRKGEVLARLDTSAAALTAAAAEAQSGLAQKQAELAKVECDRAEKLFASGTLSTAEHDRARTMCETQSLAATSAGANAGLAAQRVADALVRAPFDGVVGQRLVDVGEFVQMATPVATVLVTDPVRVQVAVPESAIARMQAGAAITFEVPAVGARSFDAIVKYVSPALDPRTRDLVIEALAQNPDGALKPGLFATVKVVTRDLTLPCVPASAVRREGNTASLFVKKGGTAVEAVVRVAGERDGKLAIANDLTAGDLVIVDPPAGLRDGARVE